MTDAPATHSESSANRCRYACPRTFAPARCVGTWMPLSPPPCSPRVGGKHETQGRPHMRLREVMAEHRTGAAATRARHRPVRFPGPPSGLRRSQADAVARLSADHARADALWAPRQRRSAAAARLHRPRRRLRPYLRYYIHKMRREALVNYRRRAEAPPRRAPSPTPGPSPRRRSVVPPAWWKPARHANAC